MAEPAVRWPVHRGILSLGSGLSAGFHLQHGCLVDTGSAVAAGATDPESRLVRALASLTSTVFIVQLDIFDHSRDVMLRNDLIGALQRFDVVAVRTALQRLEQDFPADATLASASVLLRALECRTEAHFAHCDAAREAVEILSETIQPAAMQVLGDGPGSEWAT
jgi:hypothetical protein